MLFVIAQALNKEWKECFEVLSKVGLECHDDCADGDERIFQHRWLLGAVLDERQQRRHQPIANRCHATVQAAHSCNHHTAQVALELGPVVSVIEANEL